MRTVSSYCRICEALCGTLVDVDDNEVVVRIKGDPDHPGSRGYLCPKGAAMAKTQTRRGTGHRSAPPARRRMDDGQLGGRARRDRRAAAADHRRPRTALGGDVRRQPERVRRVPRHLGPRTHGRDRLAELLHPRAAGPVGSSGRQLVPLRLDDRVPVARHRAHRLPARARREPVGVPRIDADRPPDPRRSPRRRQAWRARRRRRPVADQDRRGLRTRPCRPRDRRMAVLGDAQRDLRRTARRPGRRGHVGDGGGRAEGSCRRHHPRADGADHGGRPRHGPRAGALVRHGALRRRVCAPRPRQNTHGGHVALPHGLPQHRHRQLRPSRRMGLRSGRDRVVGHRRAVWAATIGGGSARESAA